MVSLEIEGPIWTLNLGDEDNRFSPAWLDAVEESLNTIEQSEDPAALVTIGGGKFYSNGLDIDHIGANPESLEDYVMRVNRLLGRVLTLPVPTVAAVNGHAFGTGAMLALAHDWRVMRDDRGFFCLPEVDIHIPFNDGMAALIQAKVTARTAVDAMTTGRRFSAQSAVDAGLVDGTAPNAVLAAQAATWVADGAGKDRKTLGAIKRTMFGHVLEALQRPLV